LARSVALPPKPPATEAGVTGQMRVLQVTPNFAPHLGGVETHVGEVSKRLNAAGIETQVLTADPSHELAPEEVISGTRVKRLRAYPRGRDWMFTPSLPRAIRSEPWDLVHVQSYHTLFAPTAMATAARARIPYVVTFHSGGSSSGLRTRVRTAQMRALGPLLRRASMLVSVSDFERATYSRLIGVGEEKFMKIPNGASLPEGLERIEADGRLIVSLGRLEQYKGHERVIAALPAVIEREPEARLWIAGDGPDEERLRRLAQDAGVADRVEIGAVDRTVLGSRLMGASLVVLLSDFEAHPLAVIEAASLGVPVLVADNSGMSELAAQGLARSIGLDVSARAHADAMLETMGSTPSANLKVPTWDECAASLAGLYRSILGFPDRA
jgi:glycosyltransferase involved in cell wall biosynthesis